MTTTLSEKHLLPRGLPDRCMRAYGEDCHGIWSDVDIYGVIQRFRWMPPGKFMMGSPKDEPLRDSDETQHPVEITHGFWLADTACTQELWTAVTGDNPSEFKGKHRPVEEVSWDDCAAFIKRINKENPGLNLSLPTEAQWEYACRAGTTTPFSFGDNITPDQVNYDGNYPYADGKKGRYRNETVDVKSLPANLWGLYEMHGNVWEWCEDWFGDYPTGKDADPQGPDTGVSRVLRGGSWYGNGWYCRSAIRSRFSSRPFAAAISAFALPEVRWRSGGRNSRRDGGGKAPIDQGGGGDRRRWGDGGWWKISWTACLNYERRHKERMLGNLKNKAKQMGYTIIPHRLVFKPKSPPF